MKKKFTSSKENSSGNKRNISRRNFLKLSAVAAAGAGMTISGTCANKKDELPALLPVPDKPGFEHLVVLNV